VSSDYATDSRIVLELDEELSNEGSFVFTIKRCAPSPDRVAARRQFAATAALILPESDDAAAKPR
jgi:hypothetical protein